jgi:hypothetical protein
MKESEMGQTWRRYGDDEKCIENFSQKIRRENTTSETWA